MAEERQKKKGGCLKSVLILIGIIIVFSACVSALGGGEDTNQSDSETSTDEVTDESANEDSGPTEEELEERAAMTSDPSDEETTDEPTEEVTEESTEEEVTEEETEEPVAEATPEEEVTQIVHDVIEEEEINDLILNEYEDGLFVNIVYNGRAGWSNNSTITSAKHDMSEIIVALSKTNIDFRAVDFNAQYVFTNEYGEENTQNGVQASFSGETIERIQFDDWAEMADRVEDLADSFNVHPGMRD